ncbi:acyl-phosphate glycerol 3-phosphate acyltransferase [Rhizobium sp. Leaf384]|uniref:lysophospholipid acyltransferase family protein n=1 Tax=unclassified Rhizobium TaxID=2613769 RepID=UPI0007153A9B|nr:MULTISPECIES: lysophospholipid acyltransferase family protein [unclassified Rhizobium]KQS81139.1 acyl-phosphate glycerol 3-phosphate acyltransferase [Rhizobium sp. Leaf384]KQS87047.1 acyl-phosphate glycerol 3-phosphate acyltransferase [Rhizobium sp. Leaf383]
MIVWIRVFVCVSILVVATLLLAPVQLLLLWRDRPARRTLPRLWHRIACRMIGLRVHVHSTPEARRPLMLVSNHVSWKDILVLGSVADVVFIAKAEVKAWPVFGLLARLQATIFVAREQKRTTGNQVNEIGARLAAGEIVVLFPEGTTSDGNRLLEIKSSLFGAAAAAVPSVPGGIVHVQPVAIAYTRVHGMPMGRYHRPIAAWPGDIALVPHLMGVLREGAMDVDLVFGETIDYRADSHRKQVSREVEKQMKSMLLARLRGR